MPTHTISFQYTAAGASFGLFKTVTQEGEVSVDYTFASDTTATLDPVVLTVANIKSIILSSTLDATVTPYASASAGTAIELTANVPVIWSPDAPIVGATPFAGATSAGMTKLTVASLTGCVFTLRALYTAA